MWHRTLFSGSLRSPRHGANSRDSTQHKQCGRPLVRCLLEFADAEFTQDTNESLPRARSLYIQALNLLDISELNPPPVPGLSPNPVVASLKFHAQVNLAELRSGRNIAGLQRQLELVAQSGLASATRGFRPTPHRYAVLIDRAKHLLTIAQQVEAAHLSALEKHDNEAYNLLKAYQDLNLAQASVQLQTLRAIEAKDGAVLACRQEQRSQFQVDKYQEFLDAGSNEWEEALLADYQVASGARIAIAQLDAGLAFAQAATVAGSGGFLGTDASAGWPAATLVGILAGARSAGATVASIAEANIQEHSLHNSIEQRRQEWDLQKGLAQKDVAHQRPAEATGHRPSEHRGPGATHCRPAADQCPGHGRVSGP